MPEFRYQKRSLRDVMARTVQTADQTDKPPDVSPEDRCTRCDHQRWQHCYVRRSPTTRSVLWFAEYGLHSNRQVVWERTRGRFPNQRGLVPVRCRHYQADQPDFPLCDSTACARSGCDCGSFLSPFRKPRAKKPPTAKQPAKPHKKRTAKPKLELSDSVKQDFRLTPP